MTREERIAKIAKITYGYACGDQKCGECRRGKNDCYAYEDAKAIYNEIVKPMTAKNKELKADCDTWKRACALAIKQQPCTLQYCEECLYQHGDEECKGQFCSMNDEERLEYHYKEAQEKKNNEK